MGKVFQPNNASTNPMTTKGDVIVGGAGGSPDRLAIGSNGQALAADSTATDGISYQEPFNSYNFLVNSGFDYWQAGTSTTITATGGGTPVHTAAYLADQWYVNNILGGGTVEGIVTYSQQPSNISFASGAGGFAAKVQITTAPTGTGLNGSGLELYQVLSNKASLRLLNQTASFSIQVKAFGNVNQVGLQFMYATSETQPALGNTIGSEVVVNVNSSGYTLCTINGQALGSSATVAGVIAVRVRIKGVSSGNGYDLNNGFQVEQAMLNLGPVAQTWHRQHEDPSKELAACQLFYEKSYDTTIAPGTSTSNGMHIWVLAVSGGYNGTSIDFKVTKRATPTITFYDRVGNSSRFSYFSNGSWAATDNVTSISNTTIGLSSFFTSSSAAPGAVVNLACHWVADARIS